MIDVAVGQTHLLINKKFQQFRNLIDNCRYGGGEGPVTCADLQGFWDMVYIQVNNYIQLNIKTNFEIVIFCKRHSNFAYLTKSVSLIINKIENKTL